MPEEKNTLDDVVLVRTALNKLREDHNSFMQRELLDNYMSMDANGIAINSQSEKKNIKKQIADTIEIIEADLQSFEEMNAGKNKDNPLNPLYRKALLNHYVNVATALSSALLEVNPYKMPEHKIKIEELANASKPFLKYALHRFTRACIFLSVALLTGKLIPLLAAWPLIQIPLSTVDIPLIDTIKAETTRLNEKGSEHYYTASVIYEMNKKKNLSKSKATNKPNDEKKNELK